MAGAKDRWEKLDGMRDQVLARARAAAELTIPSLMPPEGHTENVVLPTPYQSLGARGVNNLASKLLLALLPPGTAFFRFQTEDKVAEALGKDAKTDLDAKLRKLENRAMRRVERGNLRVMTHSVLKHLIVTGNAGLYMPKGGRNRMYRLDQYCAVRDAAGTMHEAVIKETVHPTTLSEEVRRTCLVDRQEGGSAKKDKDEVDVYTWIKLTNEGRTIEYHQEINDIEVPASKGRNKVEESPYLFLRWTAGANEDYGRGLVEEYIGDLRSLEGLSKSIVGFSAVAAKIILLLKPSNSTDAKKLTEAETGDVVTGTLEDIDILQLDKYADFRVAKEVIDELTLRLSHAFLLQSGTVRDAERVTAAEIQRMAQELEDVLGGVYTVFSQEFQLPVVRRLIAQMKAEGDFPPLPKVDGQPVIEPLIVTGFDALGRGHELNRLRAYFADLINTAGEGALKLFDPKAIATKFATAHNVDVEGLFKDAEMLAQEQAQETAAMLAEKAAAPVAGALAKGAVDQPSN